MTRKITVIVTVEERLMLTAKEIAAATVGHIRADKDCWSCDHGDLEEAVNCALREIADDRCPAEPIDVSFSNAAEELPLILAEVRELLGEDLDLADIDPWSPTAHADVARVLKSTGRHGHDINAAIARIINNLRSGASVSA